MHEAYDPAAVERAAQEHWRALGAYRAREHDPRFPKGKFYVCSMLPYPSGKLHMGHMRNYTLNDVVYRFMRSSGYNVMTPMGWDAFGLPAENAAIEKRVAPAEWTRARIADMKAQFAPMGFAFDWSREVTTCDPGYYRWNQWLFLKMLKSGIAYRKTQVVNWDPVDQTVLANEQVEDGRGWRSGALVEKREIPGYYLAITRYAEELLDKVEHHLEGWPAQVRTMQQNWIGRSEGVRFAFPYELAGERGSLWVFTTRADTIMGVTFVVIAPEHPLATELARRERARGEQRLTGFIEACRKGGVAEAELATMEKKGVPTGFCVVHPLSGERLEVWIGNYVLMGYGDGAVMGVPGHDERDFAFARAHGLPIKQVIAIDAQEFSAERWMPWYASTEGSRCINSRSPDGRYDYDGKTYQEAVDAVAADLAALGIGAKKVQWRLRDWGISRQRYWGTPIPIIHCEGCGVVPVPEDELPVVLPEDLVPDGTGNPLNKDERFLACTCPTCGMPARRETDTMDTFVDSSWYYMRYCCPDAQSMVDERAAYWMPMDQYIGGIEHAVLHLLYARFWTKVMRDLGLVRFDEPFERLFTQGMLLAHCYYREDASGRRRWFYPAEVEQHFDERGVPVSALSKEDGQPVLYGGIEKMSKSKNNVVEPREFIERFGADTARAFVMFAGPPDQSAPWSDASAEGVYRFLRRLWAFCHAERERIVSAPAVVPAGLGSALTKTRHEVHATLQQALFDFERMQFNTVVSAAMKMLNALEAAKGEPASAAVLKEGLGMLLQALYPIAPHITHALWTQLGYAAERGDLLDASMAQPSPEALRQDELELVVQVNGKLRGHVTVAANASEEAVKAAALADERVRKFIADKPVRKVILVRHKLINLVV
ncbi:MAG TPA: leucine--tRNA ligase [Steroidobacteraceae bacterium]|nr:leucine--tRNA ligase [Steroidobacteraceae bacterium]